MALALALNHPDQVGGLVLASGYYYPTPRADVLLVSPSAAPILGDLLCYTLAPLIGGGDGTAHDQKNVLPSGRAHPVRQ